MSNVLPFGATPDGKQVQLIRLDSGRISCEIITFGAALRSLWVPDRNGCPVDVVLGYDALEQYCTEGGYLGATVGRSANRIAKGRFSLNGTSYTLPINNGPNHLHGGPGGFSHRVWEIESVNNHAVTLCLNSRDGDEGYPGNIRISATYLLQNNTLEIHHSAFSDADTLCNLTNHSYFNLSGHDSGSAMEQKLQLFAREYTPSDPDSIPYGTIEAVEGTPMDFRWPIPIQTHIQDDFTQLHQAIGYDHNYVVEGKMGVLRPVAMAESDRTGITMRAETTLPGVHFYTGNYIEPNTRGKGGSLYGPRQGFCLETQFYPDAINHPNFPSPILKAGEHYHQKTIFTFQATP